MNSDASFVIETDGLTKRFGDRVAVDGVGLRVPRGSAFGYLGPNGAGKTTLTRMPLGLTEASTGTIAKRVGAERLRQAADKGSSISVDGSSGSATLKGLNDVRIRLIKSGADWLIASGYELDGAS